MKVCKVDESSVQDNVHRMVKKKQRVTKVVVDTSQTISQLGIQIPKIDYKVIADVTMQAAFSGMITPVPTVLIHHLKPLELLLVSVIIEETIEKGECNISQDELALRMGVSTNTVALTRSSLKKHDIITFERKRTSPSRYHINWEAVNNLDKLMRDQPRAIMARVRNTSKKRKISNMNQEDIDRAYNEKILPPNHDPREEEMYD